MKTDASSLIAHNQIDNTAYTAYRNSSSGKNSLDVCVYEASVPLTAGKTISYVVLPDVSNGVTADVPAMHIFAVTVG